MSLYLSQQVFTTLSFLSFSLLITQTTAQDFSGNSLPILIGSSVGSLAIGLLLGSLCTLALTCCIYKLTGFGKRLDFDIQLRRRGDIRMPEHTTIGDEFDNNLRSTMAFDYPHEDERRSRQGERDVTTSPASHRELPLPLFHTVDSFPSSPPPPSLAPSNTPSNRPNTLPRTSHTEIRGLPNTTVARSNTNINDFTINDRNAIPYPKEEYDIPYVPPTVRGNISETIIGGSTGGYCNTKGMTKSLSVDELKRLRLIREEGRDPEQQYHAPCSGRGEYQGTNSEHYYVVEKRPDFPPPSHFTPSPAPPTYPPPPHLISSKSSHTLPLGPLKKPLPPPTALKPSIKSPPNPSPMTTTPLSMATALSPPATNKIAPPVAVKPKVGPMSSFEAPAYVNVGRNKRQNL